MSEQAYELSTLTGTQVLLLVVSETGLVYTFTTAKLQPLVTQPEGKNLIQACLNAPHGALPSSMPVGAPIGRSSGPMNIPGGPPPSANIPGGLSIGAGAPNNVKEDDEDDHREDTAASHGGRPSAGDKRRRRASSTSGPAPQGGNRGATSPHSPNATIPPPFNIPSGQGGQPHPSHQQPNQSQIALGSPTSPQQHHPQVSTTSPAQYSAPSYAHHPGQPQHQQQQHDQAIYNSHLMGTGGYSYPPAAPPSQGGPGQQLGGLAAAAATQQPQQHGHWAGQQAQVSPTAQHYGGRR